MDSGDRRVRRTRRSLAEALIGLILEQGYDTITVQHVLDRADIGRSTFYAHFRDKESLLLSCFDGLRDDLRREMDGLASGRPSAIPAQPSLVLFRHAYEHRAVYQALCGRKGGATVYKHLHALLTDAARGCFGTRVASSPAVPTDAIAEFYASGLLGMLTWWIDGDFAGGPEHVARLHGAMADPGVTAALAPA